MVKNKNLWELSCFYYDFLFPTHKKENEQPTPQWEQHIRTNDISINELNSRICYIESLAKKRGWPEYQ